MKTIKNAVTKINVPDPSTESNLRRATYADLIKLTLDVAPQGGFDRKMIRERDRVEKALSNAEPDTDIQLEDADFEAAKKCLEAMRWGQRSADLIPLYEAFGL